MSCDIYGNVNPLFRPDEIVTYIESLSEDAISITRPESVAFLDFFVVNFTYNGKMRGLFFAVNEGIFNSHLVTMNAVDDAGDFINKVVEHFGGVIQSDAWEEGEAIVEYGKWHRGDGSVFTHRWAFASGYVDGVTLEDAKEADRLFREKMGSK